jgi:hypothetical protein
MAPAYNFETIFNFSASPLTSMSFSHNQVRCICRCTFMLVFVDALRCSGGC